MVQANTQAIQDEIEDFKSDEKIFFGVGNFSYDAVYKVEEKRGGKVKEIVQGFADLSHAYQDCLDLQSLLSMYDFNFRPYDPQNKSTKFGEHNNCFILPNPDSSTIDAQWNMVNKIVKDNADKKYVIVCLYAGHGQIKDSE